MWCVCVSVCGCVCGGCVECEKAGPNHVCHIWWGIDPVPCFRCVKILLSIKLLMSLFLGKQKDSHLLFTSLTQRY